MAFLRYQKRLRTLNFENTKVIVFIFFLSPNNQNQNSQHSCGCTFSNLLCKPSNSRSNNSDCNTLWKSQTSVSCKLFCLLQALLNFLFLLSSNSASSRTINHSTLFRTLFCLLARDSNNYHEVGITKVIAMYLQNYHRRWCRWSLAEIRTFHACLHIWFKTKHVQVGHTVVLQKYICETQNKINKNSNVHFWFVLYKTLYLALNFGGLLFQFLKSIWKTKDD